MNCTPTTLFAPGWGEEIYDVFLRAKLAEWDEYRMQVMDWEIERYLERA